MTGDQQRLIGLPNHIAIPAIYAAVGGLYILASSWFFRAPNDEVVALARLETAKGLAFVAVTAIALWFVLWRQHRRRTLGEFTFQELVDNLHDAVLLLEMPARRILYCNPAAQRMWGYETRELVGDTTAKMHMSPEHHRRFTEMLDAALGRGEVFRGEFELKRKDGSAFPSGHTISVFSDQRGRQFGVSIVRDLTEIQNFNRTIRESEERFREVVENMSEVFWISDPDKTRMEYVSPAYERIWGRSVEMLYRNPRGFLDAIVPDDRARIVTEVGRQTEGRYDVQYRIERPDGTLRWIRDRGMPFRDETGRVVRIVGFAEDITEVKQREAELMQAQKMEAMGQLTGGIAHDFNNMLMVVMANAESLVETLPEEGLRARAVRIVEAGERAADLIGRLLTFARVRPLKTEACDLNALVRETADLLKRALGSNIEIDLALAPDLWPVAADRVQLETSIINLATNARDAMPYGGLILLATENRTLDAEEAATIGAVEPGDYVEFAITDTGIGMTPDIAARVFEPFFTTKEPGKGTGLGLPMIYGFVKQSGGHVAVESSPGEGATFRLYLPRHRGRVPARDASADQVTGGAETILVTDDDPMVRELVAAQLRGLGYAIVEARDGPSALEALRRHPAVTLLFSDVVMPGGMDGAELARRALELRPGLRVLLTSGYGDAGALQRLGGEGDRPDWPVLRKPYARGELAAAVRRALGAPAA